MLGEVGFDQSRSAMDFGAVPDHRERAAQFRFEIAQKRHGILRRRIGVVGQQGEVNVGSALDGAERDATDGRKPVATVPTR